MPRKSTDFLKLHFIILIWGFTAILGKLIELSSLEIVFIRSLVAGGLLAIILRRQLKIDRMLALRLVGIGLVIGLHWTLFFASVNVANVSVCMVGVATTALWTALLEPLMIPGRRLRWLDVGFGVIVVAAVYLIFRSEAKYSQGFLLAIAAAIVSAVFSILNVQVVDRANYRVISMYEMVGATFFCGGCIAVAVLMGWVEPGSRWVPSLVEWGWLFVLASACTVYAYSEYVELLKRLSVFTVNFANNLEPVYGIVLGALIFQDHQHVGGGFYLGTLIIVAAVIAQPLTARRRQKR